MKTLFFILVLVMPLAPGCERPSKPAEPASDPMPAAAHHTGAAPVVRGQLLDLAAEPQGAAIQACANGDIRLLLLEQPATEGVSDPKGLKHWVSAQRTLAVFESSPPFTSLTPHSAEVCNGAIVGVGVEPGLIPAGTDPMAAVDAAVQAMGLAVPPAAVGLPLASPDGAWVAASVGASARVASSFPMLTGGTPLVGGPLHIIFASAAAAEPRLVALAESNDEHAPQPLGWTSDSRFFVFMTNAAGSNRARVWLIPAPSSK